MKKIVLEKMTKFRINNLMTTNIAMTKTRLITKEKRDDLYKRRERNFKESINDSIETLLEDIRLGHQPNGYYPLFFIPRFTEEEMELIEKKDLELNILDYLQNFLNKNPDLDDWLTVTMPFVLTSTIPTGSVEPSRLMKNSESVSKFCYTYYGRRTTISFHLPYHKNAKSPEDNILDESPLPKKSSLIKDRCVLI